LNKKVEMQTASAEEWSQRALHVPTLHLPVHATTNNNTEPDHSRPFPRVTLSWENLHYAIPQPASTSAGGWQSWLPFKTSATSASQGGVPAHQRRRRKRRNSTYADAEELGLRDAEEGLTGEPDEQDTLIADDEAAQEEEGMKKLLRGVEGIVYPGELCAIMGASGTPSRLQSTKKLHHFWSFPDSAELTVGPSQVRARRPSSTCWHAAG
jgi:hypothetical protein